jgi:PAS domain S-box-containing protein
VLCLREARVADQDKQIGGPGREIEGDGQSSGLPAHGQVDVGANEPFERSGQHHWKEATVTEEGLEDRSSVFFAAVEMTRMPMVLTDPRQPDNPIVFSNRAFLDLTGYEEGDILGRNCRFLQGAQTDRETIAELRRGIEERRATAVEVLNYKRDGTPFSWAPSTTTRAS